jgi:hypothetical protein
MTRLDEMVSKLGVNTRYNCNYYMCMCERTALHRTNSNCIVTFDGHSYTPLTERGGGGLKGGGGRESEILNG